MPFPVAGTSGAAAPLKSQVVYTVNNLLDPGGGTCTVSACSLRDAITAANTDAAGSSINFSLSGTITLASPLPEITDTNLLLITGPVGGITISGDHLYQILLVHSGASLTLLNLTIANAKAGTNGGAISNAGTLTINGCNFLENQTPIGDGGAIYNASPGILTVNLSTFRGNQAFGNGGAIANVSSVGAGIITLAVSQSIFQDNHATYNGGAISNHGAQYTLLDVSESLLKDNTAGSTGGAVYQGGGSATVINSTLTGNTATQGGAVINSMGWTVIMVNDTVFNNTASGAPGGSIHNSSGSLYMRNTIVSSSTDSAKNCWGNIKNDGNNIDNGASCGWVTGAVNSNSSLSGTDPLLVGLADNGGPTQTMALGPFSPAFNGVMVPPSQLSIDCPSTDQRGISRPQGFRCDVGAYELELRMIFLPLVMR
jgi:CSLREA domain-containing protein